MKVVFLSNYFNHHQKPFSDEMFRLLGNNYKFISTENFPDERKKLGYMEYKEIPYLIKYNENISKCQEIIDSSDIVISGSAPERLLRNCKKNNKIIFRCHERPLRCKEPLKYIPRYIKWHILNHSKNIYVLCSSAYTTLDYSKFKLFKDRTYKWGYFTEAIEYNDINKIINKKKKNSILWVGRLIDVKHPEIPIEIAKKLKDDKIDFELNMIGIGELINNIKYKINEYGLENSVHLLGAKTPDEVRKFMENSQIFLFTSDKREGWGAVANEAMNSGCTVIASHVIGSVPFLIKDGENGLIYEDGNIDELYFNVKSLLKSDNRSNSIGKNAYKNIIDLWNPEIAARRLIMLSKHIIDNKESELFKNGPCSKAEIIKENWYKRRSLN